MLFWSEVVECEGVVLEWGSVLGVCGVVGCWSWIVHCECVVLEWGYGIGGFGVVD